MKNAIANGERSVMNIVDLEKEHQKLAPSAAQFGAELSRQLDELLKQQSVTLGFPIEQRGKAWGSIAEKIERKSRNPQTVSHRRRLDTAMEKDQAIASKNDPNLLSYRINKSRIAQGVFFSHAGLLRYIMEMEFGEKWDAYVPVLVQRPQKKRKLEKRKAAVKQL